jgi:non-heme chloroperoxidase
MVTSVQGQPLVKHGFVKQRLVKHGLVKIAALAATLLIAMAQPSLGENVKYKPIAVKTPDGLTIAAQEWGNPNGPEILFIHGFSQSYLSWMRQVDSDLAREFHIVTYDLRGHGNSDKPLDPARYRDSKAWGDEVQAVMDAAGLKHPVLVGWSYAGRVISDYVATHGAGQLAGINFVDAPIKVDPALIGDNLKNLPLMASEDLVTNISATRTFLHGCFSNQPSADDYETMLAFNMMVLPKVRAGLSGRPLDATEMISKLKLRCW